MSHSKLLEVLNWTVRFYGQNFFGIVQVPLSQFQSEMCIYSRPYSFLCILAYARILWVQKIYKREDSTIGTKISSESD